MKRFSMVVAGFMLLASSAVFAMDGFGPMGMMGDGPDGKKAYKMHEKIMNDLGLSDDQKVQMKAQREADQKQMKEAMEAMREKHEALRKELDKSDTDEAVVNSLTGEIKELSNKMMDSRTQSILKIKKILTKEQFQKMTEKREKMREKRGDKEKKGKRKYKKGKGAHEGHMMPAPDKE